MSDDFDLAHDKLPDQPVTIGGDKSAATWHPNSGPEVPHADLIARARLRADATTSLLEATLLRDLADTLVSERESTNQIVREETALLRHKYRGAMSLKGQSQVERDEARAERDALAHVIEQVRWAITMTDDGWYVTDEDKLQAILEAAPTVSLALHDAEVKAQALDEAVAEARRKWEPYSCPWVGFLDDRAAAIREEAN